MIIATVASEQFLLESLKDAEALLQIMGRARSVGSGYVTHGGFRRVVYALPHMPELAINVTLDKDILTQDAFDALQEADRAAKAATKPTPAPEAA